ncbi:MAG: bifunctional pyr operon transcriptional regulator/uracil phosphoribosyltransferase PyrR [Deltaproteobacteria bacterium]|nr:bifunctional pyr operon transcriptional regulator/uracil phosphoribosyltransferase PyrR [Deltaproteobacteria bacterium]
MTRHVLAIADLADDEIEEIFRRAERMELALAAGETLRDAAGTIMATLFYEPSTRTRLSFEAAMWRLGGAVISAPDMKSSSAVKGETLGDTMKVVSSYADLLVIRHFWDGAARVAAESAVVPVINGGDGSHEHPTQTLCDLYTLRRAKGTLKGLTVAVGGDLKYGRTAHSLVRALARFGANIVVVPVRGMEFPAWLLQQLADEYDYRPTVARPDDLRAIAHDVHALYLMPAKPHQLTLFTDAEFDLQERLASAEPITLDALYMTRQQRERQETQDDGVEYLRVDTATFQDPSMRHTLLMHPLPRSGEIASALDRDPRSIYFQQAAYGVPVRMALVSFLLEHRARAAEAPRAAARAEGTIRIGPRCGNPNCVTRREEIASDKRFRLHREAGGRAHLVCLYCDHESRIQVIGNRKSHHFHVYEEPMYGYLDGWMRDGALVIFDSVKQAEEAGYKPYKLGPQKAIMNAGEIERSLEALTDAILAETDELNELVIIGIKTAGAFIAHRLAERIHDKRGAEVELGVVDVHGGADGILRWPGHTDAEPLAVADRSVVLVDDVINSGWTVKEALAAIWRAGRPRAARLAVLIDRGHRQLPIKPTYVGKHLPTASHERVRVRLRELDREHKDTVVIYSYVDPKAA